MYRAHLVEMHALFKDCPEGLPAGTCQDPLPYLLQIQQAPAACETAVKLPGTGAMQGHLAMWQHHVITIITTTTTLNQELLPVWLSDSKVATVTCTLSELHPSEQSANQ